MRPTQGTIAQNSGPQLLATNFLHLSSELEIASNTLFFDFSPEMGRQSILQDYEFMTQLIDSGEEGFGPVDVGMLPVQIKDLKLRVAGENLERTVSLKQFEVSICRKLPFGR